MKEGSKPEYPEKTLGDELQKMPHSKARRFKSQARLEPVQQRSWQTRKADVITVAPHVTFLASDESDLAKTAMVILPIVFDLPSVNGFFFLLLSV